MKGLLFCALLVSSSAFAAGTQIVTTYASGTSYNAFVESSFDYPRTGYDASVKTICYSGDAKGVCQLIENYAGEMNGMYSQGAHDSMDLLSCKVDGNAVKASYRLSDDYGGDFVVDRTIELCK